MRDELSDLRYKDSLDRRSSPLRRERDLYEGSNIRGGSPGRQASPRRSFTDEYPRSPRRSPPKTEIREPKLRDPGSPRPPVNEDLDDKIS